MRPLRNVLGRFALALALAHSAAALDANCTCSQFCAGTCAATNAGKPESLTMYRLTPGNVTEVGCSLVLLLSLPSALLARAVA